MDFLTTKEISEIWKISDISFKKNIVTLQSRQSRRCCEKRENMAYT